jgi:hypothetical protein
MPFVSDQQRKYCWYLYHKAKSQGKTPSWDCEEWARATPKGKLPSRKSKKRSRNSRKTNRKKSKKN